MRRIFGFIIVPILVGSVGLFLVPSAGAEGGYSFLRAWGEYGSSGNGEFDGPYGIAIDNSDNLYVADSYNDRIQKFDANGGIFTTWGSSGSGNGQFDYPVGIAIDIGRVGDYLRDRGRVV